MQSLSRRLRLAIAGLASLTVICILVVVAVVYTVATDRNRVVSLPLPTGPYSVGRAAYDWVDQSRDETFGKPGDKRELLVWTWYPAEVAVGAPSAPYMPSGLISLRDESIWQLGYQRPETVRTHSVADAPAAAGKDRFPVLVFMPGMGHSVLDYTSVVEDLTSRGYVIFGIDPTYSTEVAFPDGRLVRSSLDAREPTDPADLNVLVQTWAQDASFVISRLEAVNSSSLGRLAGRLDLSRIGVFGHSFGGAASLLACSKETRCKATADVDGSPFGGVAQTGLTQPAMFLMSQDYGTDCIDCPTTQQDVKAIRQKDSGGSILLVLAGVLHGNYQDWAVTFAPAPGIFGAMGSIDGARGLKVTEDYLAAFFGRHLSGSGQPLLDGPSPAYPEVYFPSG